MINLKSLAARLDRLEEEIRGPEKWHFVIYFAPMDIPEEERAAKEAAARAEYEAEHGPISEDDSICWLIRIVNAPREQAQTNPQPEVISGPPQLTQETQTEAEAIPTPPPVDPEAEAKRKAREKRIEEERAYQEMMNAGLPNGGRATGSNREASHWDWSGF